MNDDRFPCFDSSQLAFWLPDNWPGYNAPVRFDIKYKGRLPSDAPDAVCSAGVRLWVRLPEGDNDLWSVFSTGRFTLPDAIAWCKREADYLKRERLAMQRGGLEAATDALLEANA